MTSNLIQQINRNKKEIANIRNLYLTKNIITGEHILSTVVTFRREGKGSAREDTQTSFPLYLYLIKRNLKLFYKTFQL